MKKTTFEFVQFYTKAKSFGLTIPKFDGKTINVSS